MRVRIVEVVETQGNGTAWCYVLAERLDTRWSVVVAKHYISDNVDQKTLMTQLQTTHQQISLIDASSVFFETHEQAIEDFESTFDDDAS
jgi:hypothetical protein